MTARTQTQRHMPKDSGLHVRVLQQLSFRGRVLTRRVGATWRSASLSASLRDMRERVVKGWGSIGNADPGGGMAGALFGTSTELERERERAQERERARERVSYVDMLYDTYVPVLHDDHPKSQLIGLVAQLSSSPPSRLNTPRGAAGPGYHGRAASNDGMAEG